jgi:hypothetical protein
MRAVGPDDRRPEQTAAVQVPAWRPILAALALLILVGGAALCAEHFSAAGPGLVLALRLFAAGVFSGLGTRSEKLLSQWTLSGLLGWKQPQGARPELGERNPTMETLLVLG